MATKTASAIDPFILLALEKDYGMQNYAITRAGQTIDIQLDDVPGYMTELDFSVLANLDIVLGAGGTTPSWSEFGPWNMFPEVYVSIGGGPFVRVNAYAFFLANLARNPGYQIGSAGSSTPSYWSTNVYSVPTINAAAGATTTVTTRFNVTVPLQFEHDSPYGIVPGGDRQSSVKVRFTVAPSLYGSDHYLNPIVGGTNVTSVTVNATDDSHIQPNMTYLTSPASGVQVQNPLVQYLYNFSEQVTNPKAAGSKTTIRFENPYIYKRLWMIFIDGTGAPNTTGVNSVEIDLSPDFPKMIFDNPDRLQHYLAKWTRQHRQALPTGVWCFDLMSGSDPANPNGTQQIDARQFSTLQLQLGTAGGTNVASPAKIVTYAESLMPVGF